MEAKNKGNSYASAGVDIDAGDQAKQLIKKLCASTMRPEVLVGPGFFGGLFELSGYKQPVLVSSIDGVGTKLKIASALDKHDTIGTDLVNHCIDDILTGGAEPLFFLDYFATGKLLPQQAADIVKGLAEACREAGCALIGGETAEMPGLYGGGDYDLAGVIIGAVEKENIINGQKITAGDVIFGLTSNGLHTNGYSLVRRIFGETPEALNKHYPELGQTLGEELLKTHRCYLKELKPLLKLIKGMAHITGGGLLDNVPRCLPEGVTARIKASAWETPPIFKLIQQEGNVSENEMYHVFNMGIGMAVIVSASDAAGFKAALPEAITIGEITKQTNDDKTTIEYRQ